MDLRFKDTRVSDNGANIAVVVAPVLRFADVGFQADVRIEQLVTPERLIKAFGPELTGATIARGISGAFLSSSAESPLLRVLILWSLSPPRRDR